MNNEDEQILGAVNPTPGQREFLRNLMKETREYARGKNMVDFFFEGYAKYKYFCAYTSVGKRRGVGNFIFGFEKKAGMLHMTYPEAVPEPKQLGKAWTQDPSRRRKTIMIDDDPPMDLQRYLIELGGHSIDYANRAAPK